jgi:hypothetical protein
MVEECQWLMKLHTYGLLRDSFRLAKEMEGVRTIWRLRARHVEEAGRSIQHMQKALTRMNIQLANALSDLSGVDQRRRRMPHLIQDKETMRLRTGSGRRSSAPSSTASATRTGWRI